MIRRLRRLVSADESGMRADVAVARLFPELSRSRARSLIDEGSVTLGGERVKARRIVREGETVEVLLPDEPPATVEPEAIPLSVVYEDGDLVIVDKPAGLVVHPAPGHPGGTLVNALLARYGTLSPVGAPARPGIVHRLDKDTSGLIIVARTARSHAALAGAIAARRVARRYLALAAGVPEPPAGEIDLAIGRDHRDRKRISAATRRPREAVTRYRTIETFGRAASLLEASLETGRTHQIRVHLTAKGHPVIGDCTYGRKRWRLALPPGTEGLAVRQLLHAHALDLVHPVTGAQLSFSSPPPADFAAMLDAFRSRRGSP